MDRKTTTSLSTRLGLNSILLGIGVVFSTFVVCGAARAQTFVFASPDIGVELGVSDVDVRDEDVAVDQGGGIVGMADLGGLPENVDIAGFGLAMTGELLMAFDTTVQLGALTARAGDVVGYDGFVHTLAFDATANGVPHGVRTDAVAGTTSGLLLSFDTDLDLAGSVVSDEDLVHWNGSIFSVAFDGSASGIPRSLDVDAAQQLTSGGFLLSFDTGGMIGGLTFADEDVVRLDGGIWSMEFDASASDVDWGPADMTAVMVPEPTMTAALALGCMGMVAVYRRRSWSGMPTGSLFVSIALVLGSFAGPAAYAAEGQLEINQTCAVQTGCFPGDVAGFPVTINNPGSYVLTSNLTVTIVQAAIFPSVGDFSLDLGGYEIAGPVTCTGSGSTLSCSGTAGSGLAGAAHANIQVFNGFVRGFGFNGIAVGQGGQIHDVTVEGNGNIGIRTGAYSTVRNSIAYRNGAAGFFLGDATLIERTMAVANRFNGVNSSPGSTLLSNLARDNGADGLRSTTASVFRGNHSYGNGGNGIFCGTGCLVSDNLSAQNDQAGIIVGDGSSVQANLSTGNSGVGVTFNGGTQTSYRANDLRNNTLGATSGTGLDLGGNSP